MTMTRDDFAERARQIARSRDAAETPEQRAQYVDLLNAAVQDVIYIDDPYHDLKAMMFAFTAGAIVFGLIVTFVL